MRKGKFPLNAVGISSLLVIFAVLCLTVFALLSVSTVQAQLRLAKSTRSAISGYYRADGEAEGILSKLRAGEIPEGVEKKGDTYAYACPISENQALFVCVKIQGTEYTVLRWQVVSTTQWDADTKLPVWDGQEP